MKLDIKNKHQIQWLLRLNIQDAGPWKLSSKARIVWDFFFEPSYTTSKAKNKNDAIRNRISDFDKWRISQTKEQ